MPLQCKAPVLAGTGTATGVPPHLNDNGHGRGGRGRGRGKPTGLTSIKLLIATGTEHISFSTLLTLTITPWSRAYYAQYMVRRESLNRAMLDMVEKGALKCPHYLPLLHGGVHDTIGSACSVMAASVGLSSITRKVSPVRSNTYPSCLDKQLSLNLRQSWGHTYTMVPIKRPVQGIPEVVDTHRQYPQGFSHGCTRNTCVSVHRQQFQGLECTLVHQTASGINVM